MQKDRKLLGELAKAVRNELRLRHIGVPLRLNLKLKVEDANSDGWYISVGRYSGYSTEAQVWLDRFAGYKHRKIYYGLVAGKNIGINRLVKKLSAEFSPPLQFTDKDQSKGLKYTRLERPLPKSRFGYPIMEKYTDDSEKEYFYGMYVFDHTGLQRDRFTRLVGRISDFFQTVARTVAAKDYSDREAYAKIENRRLVQRHLLRERNSHISTLRKQQDNYICQVCGFDFSKRYGHLGRNFAEAHHRIPLNASNVVRRTSIEDLVTVCPNCHRMLHRMKGTREDITGLKQLLQKA